MDYVVPEGFNAYNVALAVYGDTSYAVKVLGDNKLTFSSSLSGLKIIYDNSINKPVAIPVNVLPVPNDNLTLQTNEGQSVYDLALMTTGMENVGQLLKSNNIDFSFSGFTKGQIKYVNPKTALCDYIRKIGLIYNTGKSGGKYVDTGYVDEGYVI